jgi:hypothetical protein
MARSVRDRLQAADIPVRSPLDVAPAAEARA